MVLENLNKEYKKKKSPKLTSIILTAAFVGGTLFAGNLKDKFTFTEEVPFTYQVVSVVQNPVKEPTFFEQFYFNQSNVSPTSYEQPISIQEPLSEPVLPHIQQPPISFMDWYRCCYLLILFMPTLQLLILILSIVSRLPISIT